ncbi:MAG: hypothetical protein IKM00_06880 [Clostridia bacterium]|nr:hypothetical protein [Clostridia bacterium]
MKEILEVIMLVCFGISWPISVWKSVRSGSTSGKSVIFMLAIIIGYIAGIASKIVGGQINYVLFMYCLNLLMVSIDLGVYFVNKHRENAMTGSVQPKRA